MSPTIGADVPESLKDEVDEYRDEDESRSAAVRRLIRRGLDADRSPLTTPLVGIAGVVFGTAIEPVAPPELFVGLGIAVLALAGGVERGLFSRSN